MKKNPRLVTIGGGTGTFAVLTGLKKYPVELTAIVSMADDGGSTGVLRDELGVLPAGDVRRALLALSESSSAVHDAFNYRFKQGRLANHNFGNLFLAALEKVCGNFSDAVEIASHILSIKGTVVPVTLDNVRLYARLADNTVVRGESNIDIPKAARAAIKKVWLSPNGNINPTARKKISEADAIIIGPGDLYTSIIPNLLISGMPEAIKKSKAKKMYVGNLTTKFGETDNFTAERFVSEIEKYLGKGILDIAIFNNKRPSPSMLKDYRSRHIDWVEPPKHASTKKPNYVLADLLDAKDSLHYDLDRFATIIMKIIAN